MDPVPLKKEKRAAIARDPQAGNAAAESTATDTTLIGCRWPTRGYARQTFAIFLNRIDDWGRSNARRLAGHKHEPATVRRDRVSLNRKRHARNHALANL